MFYILKGHSDLWSEKDCRLKGRDQEAVAQIERASECLAWVRAVETDKTDEIVGKSS